MSMNVKVNYNINWERALYDVMHMICKYVNVEDLRNLARVNHSWRAAALREKAKRRFYIQQLCFPFEITITPEDYILESKFLTLTNKLQVDPFVLLLICSDKFAKFEEEILNDIRDKLEHRMLVLIRVGEHLTMVEEKRVDFKDLSEFELRVKCNVVGLFFPTDERLARVRLAWSDNRECQNAQYEADRLARELGLDDCKCPFKSVLLLFVDQDQRSKTSATYKLVNDLQKRVNDGKETIWTGFSNALFMLQKQFRRYNEFCVPPVIMALRITGPSVMAWRLVIDSDLPLDDIIRKFWEFKLKTVTPRRDCTGLLYARRRPSDNPTELLKESFEFRIMDLVKRVFSGIPFVGTFDENSVDSDAHDHLPFMSLIIIAIN